MTTPSFRTRSTSNRHKYFFGYTTTKTSTREKCLQIYCSASRIRTFRFRILCLLIHRGHKRMLLIHSVLWKASFGHGKEGSVIGRMYIVCVSRWNERAVCATTSMSIFINIGWLNWLWIRIAMCLCWHTVVSGLSWSIVVH